MQYITLNDSTSASISKIQQDQLLQTNGMTAGALEFEGSLTNQTFLITKVMIYEDSDSLPISDINQLNT